jgi:hypothetical protein
MSQITTVPNYKVGYGSGADQLNSNEFRMTEKPGTQILPERRQNIRKLEGPRFEMTKKDEDRDQDDLIDEEYEKIIMDELLAKGDPYAKMVVEMELRELDIDYDYLDDFCVAMFGRRRLGKTFGARWLCYCLRHRFPLVIVITNTKVNGFWKKYVPDDSASDGRRVSKDLRATDFHLGTPRIENRPSSIINFGRRARRSNDFTIQQVLESFVY